MRTAQAKPTRDRPARPAVAKVASISAAEERYALVSQAVAEGIYEWDIEKNALWVSERLRTRADWAERIHPDDLPTYREAILGHLKGQSKRLECEYRFRHPDGAWHWARQHGMAQFDAQGRAYRMVGSCGDITEQKQLA